MSDKKETYLGDGLYVSFDGWLVTLRAPRADGDHWVGLEPSVLAAFERWIADTFAAASQQDTPPEDAP